MRYRGRTSSDEEVRIPILPTLKTYGLEDVPEGRGRTAVRCPFHGDKTPSATVDVDLQIFVCHTGTCGVKGNAAQIIMKVDGLGFQDAVQRAAENAGQSAEDLFGKSRSGRGVSGGSRDSQRARTARRAGRGRRYDTSP